jgi:deoxyribodipyrimidine photo-lyase
MSDHAHPAPPLEALSFNLVPSRAAGLARLADFVPRAGKAYAFERNYDWGPDKRQNISGLSPYIRHRLITEAEVCRAVLDQHLESEARAFLHEVAWRTYWKGWLEQRPQVWRDYRLAVTRRVRAMEKSPSLLAAFDEAVDGQTGIDCFDAWTHELRQTGYLHNHARMWFASIWIFSLRLPWELGADFFLRHLVDGDAASNTLCWRWVAGLHTQGKHYLATVENITAFTSGRFNPRRKFIDDNARPLNWDDIGEIEPLAAPPAYDPGLRTGVLLTDEDLGPETWAWSPGEVAAVAGLSSVDLRSPIDAGELARSFSHAALSDGLSRASALFGQPAQRLEDGDWVSRLQAWAKDNGLEQIVTAHAPQGPAAERLAATRRKLEPLGVQIAELTRAWDTTAWPHANKGFFQFREVIPALVKLPQP